MGKSIQNDFSWSKSRHERLAECSRAYFYAYYASWGGWEETAPPLTRELYVLKKLQSRFTWAGSIVHAAIRGALMAIRHGRSLDPNTVIERVHRVMQQDFVFSRGRSFWSARHRKEFSGLVEHEYGERLEPSAWRTNWENVQAALRWFFASRWPEVARRLSPEQWLEVDVLDFDRSFFSLEGVKVFAVPDFAFVDHDGTPIVVDWKTGGRRGGYDDQVLGYALYLAERHGVLLSRVKAHLVYLNEGAEEAVCVDDLALARFRQHFSQSVAQMRALLADPSANRPLAESAFPMTERAEACARCVFRRPCGRMAQGAIIGSPAREAVA